jgi:hypothetical protein
MGRVIVYARGVPAWFFARYLKKNSLYRLWSLCFQLLKNADLRAGLNRCGACVPRSRAWRHAGCAAVASAHALPKGQHAKLFSPSPWAYHASLTGITGILS